MTARKRKAEPVARESADIIAEQVERLKEVFPETVTEGRVDFDRLRAALGEAVDTGRERYAFTWAGKRDAIQLLQVPSRATLVPVPEESVNFEDTQHIFVEGENLEVLKLLYRAYFGRVKMIYIDPPYNTGNDFIYPDNFADPLDYYLRLTGQKDSEGNLLTTNPETSGRYHSAWLSMMYPRLFLARQLLRDDGVIFVSIDDHEVHNLRMVMNEVFGEENFMCVLIWKRRQNVDSRAKTGVSVDHEYALVYRRNGQARLRGQEKDLTKYSNPDNDPRGDWASDNLVGLATREQRPNLHYDLVNPETGDSYPCPEAGWRYSRDTMARLIQDGRIIWPRDPAGRPRYRRYVSDLADEFTGLSSVLTTAFNTEATKEMKELFDGRDVYDFPKPVAYLKLIVQQASATDGNDIVLDFFAGSCTTAQAVLQLNSEDGGNRRLVLVQLPEPTSYAEFPTIADIGKERICRVINKLRKDDEGQLALKHSETPKDLGFRVFKLTESNYRPWQGTEEAEPEAYARQMELQADPLVDGWKVEDVIWEVALKEGFGLASRIERLEAVKDCAIHRVTDPRRGQSFFICLEDRVELDAVRPLEMSSEDLFICRDSAITDETAANLALQCRLKTI